MDQAGRPMEGVPVVVVSMNGAVTVQTLYATTDELGFYEVGFAYTDWDVGYTIRSTATYNGNQASGEYFIPLEPNPPEPPIQIDVKFPFEIPQFGTALGFLAVGAIVAAVAILLLPKRKSKSEPPAMTP